MSGSESVTVKEGLAPLNCPFVLNGLEIFRLNKSDCSLAVPNLKPSTSLKPPVPDTSIQRRAKEYAASEDHHWSCLGLHGNSINFTYQLCKCFTFEKSNSNHYFDDAFIVGRGGFGNVYKGFIKEIKLNDSNEMILVYEYMANGTLCDHIYDTENSPLSWEQRLKILLVKPVDYVTFIQKQHKSDVYSFGVVLFEVLLGRPAVDSNLEYSQISLADWCVENGSIDETIDPFLKGKVSAICLRTYADIAENCIRENGDERPSMNDVAQRLEFVLRLQETEDSEQISVASDGAESNAIQDI
ncbi:hypothetical protein F3Y22_tig00111105pilonHSYRG00150 [Hibiscus syriacus]|uniref:Serine-threonine/tyrosine-protein kinase catalytic domain-containing protein n=1 Tax=Hibiscus syriacus TaxID=106335 RepID=A0A6A2Z0I2_HIBSY|nr:hypothetical protein F3Y22_tig00111105pilonHSYRG00150 [Hibiscus syriacus]